LLEDTIQLLSGRLGSAEPEGSSIKLAAVSMIIKGKDNPRILLIKRAERSGDPWSGQIAFPGGKRQPEDNTMRRTAERETKEEVGIDLRKSGRFLGYGPKVRTHTGSMDVVPAVFETMGSVKVSSNAEVATHRWVSLASILSPKARTSYRLQFGSSHVELPAIAVGDYVVWGLTYRILSELLGWDRVQ